jgi:hypothetical protein
VLDFSLGGSIDPSLAEMYHLNTKLDDDPITSGDQNLYPDHITLDNGQVISVVGSAASLDAYVNVAFDRFVLDTTIQGSGSLSFSSTGSLLDNITVANGSKVTVKSVFVDGDMGGFINTNVKAKVANITATGDIGKVVAYGAIQKITSVNGGIGEIRSLWDSITNINAGGRIDEIFSAKSIKTVVAGEIGTIDGGDKGSISNVTVRGKIGEIKAMKSIKVVSASEIGTILGSDLGTVSNINVTGDIELLKGYNVSKVSAGGKLHVVAVNRASGISAVEGPSFLEYGVSQSKIVGPITVTQGTNI